MTGPCQKSYNIIMQFIDSHAHLNDPAFDPDREELISKLPAAQIAMSVEIGCSPEEWQPALDLPPSWVYTRSMPLKPLPVIWRFCPDC